MLVNIMDVYQHQGAAVLSPAERAILATNEITFGEKKSLLRRYRQLIEAPKSERKAIRGPTNKFSPLMLRWVLIKMIVTDPVTVYFGFPLAIFSTGVLIVQAIQYIAGA